MVGDFASLGGEAAVFIRPKADFIRHNVPSSLNISHIFSFVLRNEFAPKGANEGIKTLR